MSCNYAEGLSPYKHKGILGLPEKFESGEELERKCVALTEMIRSARHVVVHSGAGISTAAGIPDFRGPNGVWTLEKKGEKPSTNISFADARPTSTHMILRKLVEVGLVKYVVSQNIDSLHMRSGLGRDCLSELHGNMYVDVCNVCDRQFIRSEPVKSVGKRSSGQRCLAALAARRPCRGVLHDSVLDWEHSLPERELVMAEYHSSIADLSICLGTTLQIIPSGNLPLETLRYGGKLIVCNLQPTKHDNKADLKINYYVDEILERVMKHLNLETPSYDKMHDPTFKAKETILEWTIDKKKIVELEKLFKSQCKGVKKQRILVKKRKHDEQTDIPKAKCKFEKDEKPKNVTVCKNSLKQELINSNDIKSESSLKIEEETKKYKEEKETEQISENNGKNAILNVTANNVKSEVQPSVQRIADPNVIKGENVIKSEQISEHNVKNEVLKDNEQIEDMKTESSENNSS